MNTNDLELKLNTLLKSFDIPTYRKENSTIHNLKWLEKNLSKRNENNENYSCVMNILHELINKKR